MIRARLALATAAMLACACREELHPVDRKPVEPPVATPSAIPEAPVSGTIRGARFAIRDARYVVDRRLAYAHTDIKLSAGSAEAPCGAPGPAGAASVWLRLEGDGRIASGDFRVEPGKVGPWSVHYQVREADGWLGSSDATAIVSLHEPGPDGKLSGGIAVCFSDDMKSCVSGSFDALACPPAIDQPVRGTPPPEAIPEKYAHKLQQVTPVPGAASAPAR